MSKKPEFVLFDVIGTTVLDSGVQGDSLVLSCFVNAFRKYGIGVTQDQVNQYRGMSKRVAVQRLLSEHNGKTDLEEPVYTEFMGQLDGSLSNLTAAPGAIEIFNELKRNEIRIGLGSGLPLVFIHSIIDLLGWSDPAFDYLGSSDELGKSRPDPIMISDAMIKLGLNSVRRILKVGDTRVDVEEGINAGAQTALVLTGTQVLRDVGDTKPDYILHSLSELRSVLGI